VTATSTHSRTRFRGRWLLLLPVLLAAGLTGWMQSSPGDPRFVGTWRIAGSDRSADATITLNANELGHWPRTLSGDLEHFPWTVRDGRFVLGWPARRSAWWVVRDLISKLSNRQDYPGNMDLQIIDVAPNRIILRPSSNSLDVVLTRTSN
jgi:hypothetical protein